jgi:hypothetical protein
MTFLEKFKRPKIALPALGVVVVLIGALLALFLHSGSPRQVTKQSDPTPAQPSTTIPNPNCPLTGTPASTPQIPQRPALAVKVDNYPAARPQSGLNSADIVFEEPVEGGITRLVAVYQCQQTSLVGPVRSAREPDVAIIDLLSKPIFVHVGGIPPIEAMVKNTNSYDEDLFYDGSLVINPPGRQAPYDSYISPKQVWSKYSYDTTPPNPLFSYSTTSSNGTPISRAYIPFSPTNDNTWVWNPFASLWDLSIGNTVASDNNGTQISTNNVLILTVQTFQGPWVENSLGAHEVEVNATSGGPMQLLRNGVDIQGNWSRPQYSDPISLTDSAGNAISLSPGRTWIELVPSQVTPSITQANTTMQP